MNLEKVINAENLRDSQGNTCLKTRAIAQLMHIAALGRLYDIEDLKTLLIRSYLLFFESFKIQEKDFCFSFNYLGKEEILRLNDFLKNLGLNLDCEVREISDELWLSRFGLHIQDSLTYAAKHLCPFGLNYTEIGTTVVVPMQHSPDDVYESPSEILLQEAHEFVENIAAVTDQEACYEFMLFLYGTSFNIFPKEFYPEIDFKLLKGNTKERIRKRLANFFVFSNSSIEDIYCYHYSKLIWLYANNFVYQTLESEFEQIDSHYAAPFLDWYISVHGHCDFRSDYSKMKLYEFEESFAGLCYSI